MSLKKKITNNEDREYWEFVERSAKTAEDYPIWKRGGETVNTNDLNRDEISSCQPPERTPALKLN